MCQFRSLWVLKDCVRALPYSDSHEDIREHFWLHVESGDKPLAVKVEVMPRNGGDARTDWVFRVDQDILPDWYDAADVERRSRAFILMEEKPYDNYAAKHSLLYVDYAAKCRLLDVDYFTATGQPTQRGEPR